jgi:phosphoglycerate dehydrogenase-like enzyme
VPALHKMVIDLPESPDLAASLQQEFPAIAFVPVTDESRLPEAMRGADAMLTWHVTPEVLEAADGLKWVQAVSAGVDRFLTPALREHGIVLTNTSGVHASNIAEHILALMLAFARRLPQLLAGQRRHEWQHAMEENDRPVFELGGQTVLIAGMGDIGLALAQRAQCLGMSIIGVRRHPASNPPYFEVGTDRLLELLPEAEHVVDTLPLTTATRGLFGDRAFTAMKEGTYFYNVGRGPTADTGALIRALRSGKLAGAGLDVVDPEPLPAESPLWEMPNVIITSHTSGQTPYMRDRIRALLAENIRRYQHGEPLMNVVNQSEGY